MALRRKIRDWLIDRGIPGYAFAPILCVLAAEAVVYWGPMLINRGRRYCALAIGADSLIPVDGRWVVVYFSAFLFWTFGFLAVIRDSREACFRSVSGDLIGKAICMAFFLIMPTTLAQPDVSGPGAGNALLRFLYAVDRPENLFPSIHCYWTWYLCRWLGRREKRTRAGTALSYGYALLVFYSTLATRQHTLVDVPAGVAVAEIALYLERKLDAGRIFTRIGREGRD